FLSSTHYVINLSKDDKVADLRCEIIFPLKNGEFGIFFRVFIMLNVFRDTALRINDIRYRAVCPVYIAALYIAFVYYTSIPTPSIYAVCWNIIVYSNLFIEKICHTFSPLYKIGVPFSSITDKR